MARKTVAKATKSKGVKSKAKTSPKKKVGEEKGTVAKLIHLQPKMLDLSNARTSISEFYIKKIDTVEGKTHMVSNVSKYCDPLSSGSLCIDWLFNGGYYNGFASVSLS